eukprot:COSAG01_NODE_227_length_21107_cov_85.615099_16_plen_106_part_00
MNGGGSVVLLLVDDCGGLMRWCWCRLWHARAGVVSGSGPPTPHTLCEISRHAAGAGAIAAVLLPGMQMQPRRRSRQQRGSREGEAGIIGPSSQPPQHIVQEPHMS